MKIISIRINLKGMIFQCNIKQYINCHDNFENDFWKIERFRLMNEDFHICWDFHVKIFAFW